MNSHTLAFRELVRQELLGEAAYERRLKQLAPTNQGKMPSILHQVVAVRPWISKFVANLRSTPRLAPQVVTYDSEGSHPHALNHVRAAFHRTSDT